jgi:hypothetical protein
MFYPNSKKKDKLDDASLVLFIFFIIFSPKNCLGGHLFRAFNALFLNQTKQITHQHDSMTYDHTWI